MVDSALRGLLEGFAQTGHFNGFSLRILEHEVKNLEAEGILCTNPIPTRRPGEFKYSIDFSHPVKGKLSEQLYNMAVKANSKK